MRRSQKIFTLLRIQFESANQKKLIFGRYQSYKRRNLKKSRVALGTRMAQELLGANILKTRNPGKVKKRPLCSATHVRNRLPL